MFTFAEIVATSKRSREGRKDIEWINVDLNIDSSGDGEPILLSAKPEYFILGKLNECDGTRDAEDTDDTSDADDTDDSTREYEKNKRTKEARTQKKKNNTKSVKGRHSYSSAIST